MRVLVISHFFHPHVGGVEITAEVLARGFVERFGDDVLVATTTSESDGRTEFPFDVLRSPSRAALMQAVRGADVVLHNNIAARFLGPHARYPRPLVVALRYWVRDPDMPPTVVNRARFTLKEWLIRRADVVVANSEATRRGHRGVDRVIPNGYRDDVFGLTAPGPRDPRKLVAVGRLDPVKGFGLAIDALASLPEEVTLTIIGDGPVREELADRARGLGVAHRVDFRGRLTGRDLADALNAHGVLVVPSLVPEPFGTVALEGAACGCVVVGAGHGGLPEAIGPAGPTFEPRSAADLARVVARLIDEPQWYAEFQAALSGHAAAHRQSVMIDAYHRALVDAVERARRSPLARVRCRS